MKVLMKTKTSNRVRRHANANRIAPQVQPSTPRAAINGDFRLPAFLKGNGWLIDGRESQNLWTGEKSELWLAPHPYQDGGEKKITYSEAIEWLAKDSTIYTAQCVLARNGIFSGNPQTKKSEMALASELRMRQMKNPLDLEDCTRGLRNKYSFSDEEVLDFVCSVIVDHEEALLVLAKKRAESGDTWIVEIGQGVFTAARAVTARARWYGLKATPTEHDCLDEDEYRREPLLLDLPGLSGFYPYTDKQLLFQVCCFLYQLQQEIFDSVLPNIRGRKRLVLAEAVALAEQDVEREGADETELTNLRHDELSKWQRTVSETLASLNQLSKSAFPVVVPMREQAA